MKKIAILISSLFVFFSCYDDNSFPDTPTDRVIKLSIDLQDTVKSEGQSDINLTIEGGDKWYAGSNRSWCKVSSPSGEGNGTITITVQKNIYAKARTAVISVYDENMDINPTAVTITQKGTDAAPFFNLLSVSLPYAYDSYFDANKAIIAKGVAELKITFESNCEYKQEVILGGVLSAPTEEITPTNDGARYTLTYAVQPGATGRLDGLIIYDIEEGPKNTFFSLVVETQ